VAPPRRSRSASHANVALRIIAFKVMVSIGTST
jgi:hypothetical protein